MGKKNETVISTWFDYMGKKNETVISTWFDIALTIWGRRMKQ